MEYAPALASFQGQHQGPWWWMDDGAARESCRIKRPCWRPRIDRWSRPETDVHLRARNLRFQCWNRGFQCALIAGSVDAGGHSKIMVCWLLRTRRRCILFQGFMSSQIFDGFWKHAEAADAESSPGSCRGVFSRCRSGRGTNGSSSWSSSKKEFDCNRGSSINLQWA